MILLMNFEQPTTCRYDMPHVVAYVVAYVVLVWGVDVCFGRLQTCRGARFGRQWATTGLPRRKKDSVMPDIQPRPR